MRRKMKRIIYLSLLFVLVICTLTVFLGCQFFDNNTVDKNGRWEDAIYRKNMEFGEGSKTVNVEIKVEEQSVTFTFHTDKELLGDVLIEHGIVEGEPAEFGLYVKKVNGMLADYDVDQTYWALYKNGAYSMTGVDTTVIADGEHYEFVLEG